MSVATERDAALLDVQRIAQEYGMQIIVFIRGEAGIIRDTYQSIAQATQAAGPGVNPVAIAAWPIIYDPNQRELDRAGIFERCDVLVWTPMKEWTDKGVQFDGIDAVRSTVAITNVDGVLSELSEYHIRQKQRASRFAATDLHVVLALTKVE